MGIENRFSDSTAAVNKDFATFAKAHTDELRATIDELWHDIAKTSKGDATKSQPTIILHNHGRLILLFRLMYVYAHLTNKAPAEVDTLIGELEQKHTDKNGTGKLTEAKHKSIVYGTNFCLAEGARVLYATYLNQLKASLTNPNAKVTAADSKDSKDSAVTAISANATGTAAAAPTSTAAATQVATTVDTLAKVKALHDKTETLFVCKPTDNQTTKDYINPLHDDGTKAIKEFNGFRKELNATLKPFTTDFKKGEEKTYNKFSYTGSSLTSTNWKQAWTENVARNLQVFADSKEGDNFPALHEALKLAVTAAIEHEKYGKNKDDKTDGGKVARRATVLEILTALQKLLPKITTSLDLKRKLTKLITAEKYTSLVAATKGKGDTLEFILGFCKGGSSAKFATGGFFGAVEKHTRLLTATAGSITGVADKNRRASVALATGDMESAVNLFPTEMTTDKMIEFYADVLTTIAGNNIAELTRYHKQIIDKLGTSIKRNYNGSTTVPLAVYKRYDMLGSEVPGTQNSYTIYQIEALMREAVNLKKQPADFTDREIKDAVEILAVSLKENDERNQKLAAERAAATAASTNSATSTAAAVTDTKTDTAPPSLSSAFVTAKVLDAPTATATTPTSASTVVGSADSGIGSKFLDPNSNATIGRRDAAAIAAMLNPHAEHDFRDSNQPATQPTQRTRISSTTGVPVQEGFGTGQSSTSSTSGFVYRPTINSMGLAPSDTAVTIYEGENLFTASAAALITARVNELDNMHTVVTPPTAVTVLKNAIASATASAATSDSSTALPTASMVTIPTATTEKYKALRRASIDNLGSESASASATASAVTSTTAATSTAATNAKK